MSNVSIKFVWGGEDGQPKGAEYVPALIQEMTWKI